MVMLFTVFMYSYQFSFMSCSECMAICYFFGWVFETSFQLLSFPFWIWRNISILQVLKNIWRCQCNPKLLDWCIFIFLKIILVDGFVLCIETVYSTLLRTRAALHTFPLRFTLSSCEIKVLDKQVSFLIYKVKVKSASRTLLKTLFTELMWII